MTRLLSAAEPIDVQVETGTLVPVFFRWNGQGHPVNAVAKRWRVDVDWWLVQIWCDYFKLITATGLLVTVCHDLLTNRWTLYRLYD